MQGASLVPLLRGDEDVSWRQSHYYHYYVYPIGTWYRHEGAYDGRYKLIHYDVGEWELIDMQTDPNRWLINMVILLTRRPSRGCT